MNLRICHLGKYYPPAPGGIEVHVQTLARAQAELGARVEVVCVNHRDRTQADATWRAVGATPTVVETDRGVRVSRVGRVASVARLDLCPGLINEIRRVREAGVDIVHVHTPNPTMYLALAALAPFATLVVSHHSDVIRQRVLVHAFALIERRVHARAAMVLSSSDAYAAGSSVLRRLGSRVKPLPYGLDLAPFTSPSPAAVAWEAKLRASHGSPLWLVVGRLVYYKGLPTALQALKRLPGRLLVIGSGPLERQLRASAASIGVADRIEWVPYAEPDQLVGAYRAASALWFPSNARSEAFGLVQVEAMASGCAVINTAIEGSGVAWVSRDGETGLTVPVDDPAALARSSLRLLEDADLAARLRSGATARARTEFDREVMIRRMLRYYEEALGAAPPATSRRSFSKSLRSGAVGAPP
jgi:glycosyltransferase involved in cell wall biosynthesis